MINLLPQYWQDKLKEEENFKTVAILGIAGMAASLVFVLALALVWVFYSAELKAGEVAIAEKEQEMEIFSIAAVETDISSSNDLAATLDEFYIKQAKVTGAYLRIAASLPPGANLKEFKYVDGKINLTGFAPDRDSLVVFKNSLEKQPEFKSITFPPDNWLTAQDIDFSVSFEYEPQ